MRWVTWVRNWTARSDPSKCLDAASNMPWKLFKRSPSARNLGEWITWGTCKAHALRSVDERAHSDQNAHVPLSLSPYYLRIKQTNRLSSFFLAASFVSFALKLSIASCKLRIPLSKNSSSPSARILFVSKSASVQLVSIHLHLSGQSDCSSPSGSPLIFQIYCLRTLMSISNLVPSFGISTRLFTCACRLSLSVGQRFHMTILASFSQSGDKLNDPFMSAMAALMYDVSARMVDLHTLPINWLFQEMMWAFATSPFQILGSASNTTLPIWDRLV